MPSFKLIVQNPKEEFEKVGFRVFAILRKKIIGGNGRGLAQVIHAYVVNLGI